MLVTLPFAAMDTTVGVVGLMVAIVALVVVIAIFVAIQIAGEHSDNMQPGQRL